MENTSTLLQVVPENTCAGAEDDSDFDTVRTHQDSRQQGDDFSPEALVRGDNRIVRLVRVVHFTMLVAGTLAKGFGH
jgi:hypothetical protein